nr:hypothetical protein [Streptomyces sabulosicollis]
MHSLIEWAVERRYTAVRYFLCGICYGTGTTVVSLIVIWLRARY